MLTYEDAKQRLCGHAGLRCHGSEPSRMSFDLYEAERMGNVLDVAEWTREFHEIFSTVNRHSNGDIPSEVVQAQKAQSIDRNIAYAVDLILWDLLCIIRSEEQSPDAREACRRIFHVIAWCWDGVLAGDIDDLREHVELQSASPRYQRVP